MISVKVKGNNATTRCRHVTKDTTANARSRKISQVSQDICNEKLLVFKQQRLKSGRNILLNISGEIYETFEETLERFPHTLLGCSKSRQQFYSPFKKDYFFNRNREAFGPILFFYQSYGILRCPPNLNLIKFEEECRFFRLPENDIQKMRVKAGLIPELNRIGPVGDLSGTIRATVWNILEHPETTRISYIFTIISLVAILLSIMVLILETETTFYRVNHMITFNKKNNWAIAELALNIFFLVEFIGRFISSPSKLKFLSNWMNIVDAIAIIPFFGTLIFTPEKGSRIQFLRTMRLARVLRLFKISKHSRRLKLIGHIILRSLEDLKTILLAIGMMVIFVGTIMYHLEETPDFTNIPSAMYWGVQTVCSIGYGDIVVTTIPSKIIAGLFMLVGALVLALPMVPIITKFDDIYLKNTEDIREREFKREETERKERALKKQAYERGLQRKRKQSLQKRYSLVT